MDNQTREEEIRGLIVELLKKIKNPKSLRVLYTLANRLFLQEQ